MLGDVMRPALPSVVAACGAGIVALAILFAIRDRGVRRVDTKR